MTTPETMLDECYALAERIIGFSRPGIELTKRMLWDSLDASSLGSHMHHEGIAQLFVRLTTQELRGIGAGAEGEAPAGVPGLAMGERGARRRGPASRGEQARS